MTRPPRWAYPSQVEGASTVTVTVSGPGGLAQSKRVATAAYLWARHCGAPLPDVGRICRYGPHVVVPFSGQLSEELVEEFNAAVVELFATGGDSLLLGENTTGSEVSSVQAG